jgi:Protein phosphatase 2C
VEASCQWRHLAASVAGTSHTRRNLPCQDYHSWNLLGDNTIIAAVADGAGSAERSQEGSKAAVEAAIQFFSSRMQGVTSGDAAFYQALIQEGLKSSRRALEAFGMPDLHQVATTLLLAILSPDWLAVGQVGDGGIVAEFGCDDLRVLTVPASGEYLNETSFITSTDFLARAHYEVLPSDKLSALALFTDGIQFLALRHSDNTAHKPFFDPLFDFVASRNSDAGELEAFLMSEKVCEQTDDDKTLIVAVRSDLSRPGR